MGAEVLKESIRHGISQLPPRAYKEKKPKPADMPTPVARLTMEEMAEGGNL
eukprot:CAMPEP_0175090462 /NCGR_PEP_ID=MMETSP0086_2-20121207/1359_1 /TAXON_ID=136419 /ORGANISM="Unknown Unknown, Strain D1" /LENGTH=50 /DNA_ID=CAMNT_0016363093 /DNA_START=305 /DNA_END=457 /DNA_ORIENTATION=+